MYLKILLPLLFIALGIRKAAGSYLDVPRLHFTGQFLADTNTGNNLNCNFDTHNTISPDINWNPAGNNDFQFIDTVITSVIDEHGKEDTKSKLIGAEISGNEIKPFAKLTDLDTDFAVSTVFGLRFGLKLNGTTLFVGNWKPSIISNDWWHRVKCTQGPYNPDESIRSSVQSTTKIVDIEWSDSPLINEFKSACEKSSGELHVSITLDSYSYDVYSIGRVYGTIGLTNSKEPLCVGGERKMVPVDPGPFQFDHKHPCRDYQQEEQKPWTYGAPFKLDLGRKVLVVDLSNSFPTYFSSVDEQKIVAQLNIGDLHFGYILNGQTNKIKPIGERIPYLENEMWIKSGIIEVPITDEEDILHLQDSQLVIFTESSTITHSSNAYEILLHSGINAIVLLKETEFFVRPMGNYMTRLQHSSQLEYSGNSFITDNHKFTLLVTKFGKPASNEKVTMIPSNNEFGRKTHVMPYPYDAVKVDQKTKVTNEEGYVNFIFILEKKIPIERHYTLDPNCTSRNENEEGQSTQLDKQFYKLPIDGQVYAFYYCVGDECELPEDDGHFLYRALISILAFSNVYYESDYEPTWIDDVEQIFKQQHHISRVMNTIMDMSNFTDVTLPHNIELLKYVLSKDSKEAFEYDPSYMPTTRDLSPAKRQMILKWLRKRKPCFDSKSCDRSDDANKDGYIRCHMKDISYASDPQDQDNYFKYITADNDFKLLKENAAAPLPRPLFGLAVNAEEESHPSVYQLLSEMDHKHRAKCNVTGLKTQLQQAVQLEFNTIPLYTTALYSIIENHNTDAYQAIRDIVMQEMLHMVQVANILIAVGGKVMIDDPNYAPSYPTKGLPGGVLPNLRINLTSYHLKQVHDTFMSIELPTPHKHNSDKGSILLTIGMFYKEIEKCINSLGDDIFTEPKVHKQVKWPWNTNNLGTVHVITDVCSARRGIDEIIEQGEGADYLNPNQISTDMYAHYYRFEELVCQRRLKDHGDSYAFDGAPIVYNESGVYPMTDDANKESFPKHSRCYTRARAFHRVYRNLLRIMQKAFNGYPEMISEAIDLMESVQVHAKRCISTPYEGTKNNCAPVWDYEWD